MGGRCWFWIYGSLIHGRVEKVRDTGLTVSWIQRPSPENPTRPRYAFLPFYPVFWPVEVWPKKL